MASVFKKNLLFYSGFVPVFIGCSFITPLAPLAIGGGGMVWFIVKKRYDYLIILFLLALILANNKSPIFIHYEKLRVVLAVLLFVLSGIVIFKKKGFDDRIMYFIPFFIVAFISSLLFSPRMVNSVFKVISYLMLVVIVFMFIKYFLREDQFKLYEQILLLISISLIISLLGGFLYPTVFKISGRLNGVFGNPNFLGLFCVLSYAFVDHYKTDNSILTKNEIFFLKVLVIVTLFLTGSRNGYASLAIYIITSIFLYRGISGKTVAIILGLGGFIAITQLEALTQFLPFLNELVRPETISTASGRSVVWPVAVDEIFRNPWLGGGFEYYSYYMINYAAKYGLKGVFWYGVWNTYLAILLDTGLLGLLSYFFFIYGVIVRSSPFKLILPFLAMMIFTGMFEAWAVSSLNPITPFFLLFFVVISIQGSRYENLSIA